MDMVVKILWMEIAMRASIKMESLMEKDTINGIKEAIIRVSLFKEWEKEEVNGLIRTEPSIKVIIFVF